MAGAADDDDRVDEILGAWRSRCDAGEVVDPRDVIVAHPEHAAALHACFDALGLVCAAVAARPPATPLRPLPGGRYAGFRLTGEGGMGIVYCVTDTDLGRDVAFKVVRPRVDDRPVAAPTEPLGLAAPDPSTPESSGFRALRSRFLREARITAALEHPGIVPVHDIGETPEGVPYYTMRLVRGNRTLAQAIAETPPDRRLALLDPYLKVCDTIRYAHARGVLHRDLKPANVAIGEYGDVVVIDWGLARQGAQPAAADAPIGADAVGSATPQPLTCAGAVGTPGYMAPEAALGRAPEMDERSDVYSLGAILFEILTGRLPFPRPTFAELVRDLANEDPPNPAEIAHAVPPVLARIAQRALARLPGDRFASVDALAAAVRAWQMASARDAEIAAARRAVADGVAVLRAAGAETTAPQIAAASHLCRKVLELVPGDAEAQGLLAELAGIHDMVVARTVRAERRRTLRRVTTIGLSAAIVAAVAFAVTIDAERRRTQAERDLKAGALGLAEAESASRREALDRAERMSLRYEARALVGTDPGLAMLVAQEAWRRHPDPSVAAVMLDALCACREERTLVASSQPLAGAWYDPSGRRAVTVGVDGAVRVWDAATGRLERTIAAHASEVIWAGIDAQGRRVVTAPADGSPVVLDLDSGERIATLAGHRGAVDRAEFSPDGRLVATAGWDGTARLWSAADGRQIAVLAGHAKRVRRAAFSPDGTRVATASEDGDARVWDVATGALLLQLVGHRGRVFDLDWSADGTRIATASEDMTARVWDAATGESTVLAGHDRLVIGVSFSPSGDRVLTASWDGYAHVHDAATGALLVSVLGDRWGLHGAAWSRDGARFVTAGSWDHAARCWAAADGREIVSFLGHCGRIGSAAFSPDGQHVLTGAEDGTARIWDAGGRRSTVRVAVGKPAKPSIAGARLSGDGRWFLTAERDAPVRIWDASTGAPAATLDGTDGAAAVSFDAASRRVVAGCADGAVAVFDVPSGAPRLRVRQHVRAVTATEFSPDGAAILSASKDGTMRLCDAATGAVLRSFGAGAAGIVSAHLSRDGRRVVASIEPNRWSLFDAQSGAAVCGAATQGAAWDDVAVSSDGLRVTTTRRSGETLLWDAASGREVASLGDQDGPCPAEFDDAGGRVASALAGGVVRISSAASGRELLTIPTDGNDLTSVHFSRDGRFLVTTTTHESTRVHDAGSGALLRELVFPDSWVMGSSADDDGGRLLTWSDRGVVRVGPLDIAAAVARAAPRELSAADRARFGVGGAAPAAQRLDDVVNALTKDRADVALTLARAALEQASPDADQRARLLYFVACALLRRAAGADGAGVSAAVVDALGDARRAGADPARLADSGLPDVADSHWLERLPLADADAVLAAAFAGRPANAEDVGAWDVEAHDAAARGNVEQAISLYRRVLAAGASARTPVLVELARLRCRRAASKPAGDRTRDLDAAIGRLEEAAREPGGLPPATLDAGEFAPLRDDARFRALARGR